MCAPRSPLLGRAIRATLPGESGSRNRDTPKDRRFVNRAGAPDLGDSRSAMNDREFSAFSVATVGGVAPLLPLLCGAGAKDQGFVVGLVVDDEIR